MSDRILKQFVPSVPPGWKRVSIAECLQEVSKPIRMRDSESYRLVSIRRRSEGMFDRGTLYGREILTKTLQEVVPSSFVIARMQVIHGATALAPPKFAGAAISKSYSSFVGTLICDTNFFSWLAKHPLLYAYYADASQGVVIEKMTFDQNRWLSYPIYLPPMAEQRAIARILDTVDELIWSTDRLIAKLEQVRRGVLHDLLTCGIDESGHLRDPLGHPGEFRDSTIGLIPKQWRVVRCGELCSEIVVGIVVKPAQYYAAEGVPILRSANVREEGIDMSDLKFMSHEDHRMLSKSSVRTGDVLTVRTGYPGTSAVITEDIGEANCVDVIISRPNDEIMPDFLALWVNSPFGRGQVLTGQGGLAQQHFNIGQMKKLAVAVPSVREQRLIAEIASSWGMRIRTEKERLEKLRQLKQGLMDDLLTGRVRVEVSG